MRIDYCDLFTPGFNNKKIAILTIQTIPISQLPNLCMHKSFDCCTYDE